jgi:hypothetical protein
MVTHHDPVRPAATLTDKLDELESLIPDEDPPARGQPMERLAGIPVLDDLVEPFDTPPDDEPAEPGFNPENEPDYRSDADRLSELANRLEQRLLQEMEDLVGVLRGVVRRHIKQELHDALSRETDATPRPPEKDN